MSLGTGALKACIHKDWLKTGAKWLAKISRIYKDFLKTPTIWSVVGSLSMQRVAHTKGKVPCQRRGGAKPLLPPRIMSHSAWLKLCDFAGCYSTYCRLSSFVVSCHVKDLASGIDIVASFNKECKQGEKVRRGYILYCCVKIKNGKWLEPRSCVLEWNLVSRVKWVLVLTDVSTS